MAEVPIWLVILALSLIVVDYMVGLWQGRLHKEKKS